MTDTWHPLGGSGGIPSDLMTTDIAGERRLKVDLGGVEPGGDDYMEWKGAYASGEYNRGDVVVAGNYTRVANVTTLDSAAIVPIEEFSWPIYGDTDPEWEIQTDSAHRILTGVRIDGQSEYITQVEGIRAWIPLIDDGVKYYLYVEQDGVVPNYVEIFPGVTGWYIYTNVSAFLQPGADVDVYLITQGQGTGFTQFSGEWDYRNIGANPAPTNPPNQSNFRQYGTNAPETVYWNVYDRDLVDRTTDMANLKAGDVVEFQWMDVSTPIDEYSTWTLSETPEYYPHESDSTLDMFILTVSPAAAPTDPNQRSWRDFTATIYEDAPLQYVKITDKFALTPSVKGLISFDGVSDVVETNDGYGIDLFRQRQQSSADWTTLSGGASASPSEGIDVSGMPVEELTIGEFFTTETQTPTGEGAANAIIVHFGTGGSTDGGEFDVNSDGIITCNKNTIQYDFNVTIRLQREGSPGTSHVVARMMYAPDGINYIQTGRTFGVKIDDADTVWRETFEVKFSPAIGSKLYIEFARDPASSNSGEIGTFQPSGNLAGWNPIPSASIEISKTVIT